MVITVMQQIIVLHHVVYDKELCTSVLIKGLDLHIDVAIIVKTLHSDSHEIPTF